MIPIRDDVPHTTTPWVNYFLIALNTLVFLFEVMLAPDSRNDFIYQFAVIPSHTTAWVAGAHGIPLTAAFLPLLTSMFLHGGWLHIIGNMWFLWIFGDNVEDAMGRLKFLAFYILCGLAAALAQVLATPSSAAPMVGASGAIAGVLGAYLLLYPRARVRCLWILIIFITFVDVPAWALLGLWFLSQFFVPLESGVAWMAHVGGFLAGLGLVRLFVSRQTPPPMVGLGPLDRST
jgi:membrane associated rhomboid family serine protease